MVNKSNSLLALAALLALACLATACDSGGGGGDRPQRNNGADCAGDGPAALGCPCAPSPGCAPPGVCDDGVCTAPGDNNGNNGNNPDPCEENPADPACDDNNGPVTGARLRVGSPDARACEALIEDPNFLLREVRFGDGVRGSFVQRGPRGAVAFTRDDDAAFEDGTITLLLAGDAQGADSLSLREAACFDKDAQPIAQPDLAIAR